MRNFRLGLRLVSVAPTRHILLTLLVAAGLVTYVVFAQLEAVAGRALQEAVEGEFGSEGQYAFTVAEHAVADPLEFADRIEAGLAPKTDAKVTTVMTYPLVSVGCATADAVVVGVLPTGATSGPGLRWGQEGDPQCVGGVMVPADWVATVSGAPYSAHGVTVVMRAELARSAMVASTVPGELSYVVTAASSSDQIMGIVRDVVRRELGPYAALHGLNPDNLAVVTHLNHQGEDVKSAAEQAQALYAQLRWAVVAFAALVLLVVQVGQVRRRMWLFGLARAHGGGAPVIVASVTIDSAVAVVTGGVVAILGIAFASPFMAGAAINLGQSIPRAVEPIAIAQLALGAVVLLAVGAVVPTAMALKSDPLDVLEPRTD